MVAINEDEFVAEVLFCIKQSDVVKSKALLQYFPQTSIETQKRTLYEMSNAPETLAYPLIEYLYDTYSANAEIEPEVYRLLLEVCYGNPKLLIGSLNSKDLSHKIPFIRMAGELKLEEAAQPLLDILKSAKQVETFTAVLRALGAIGSTVFIKTLADFLKVKNLEVKAAAAGALAEIGNPAAIQLLANAINGIPDADRLMINELTQLQNQPAIEVLVGVLASNHTETRNMALEALVHIGQKVVPILAEHLKSDNNDLVIHALTVMGRVGDPSATPAIQRFLFKNPKNSNVRYAAYEALGRLPTTKSAISLAMGLEDPDEQVRMAAAKAIDHNLSDVLMAGLKNMIKAGDDQAKAIVGTLIDTGADNIFNQLVEWETFPALAVAHLVENAHPDMRDHYTVMLEGLGRSDLAESVQQAGGTASAETKMTIYAVDDSKMMLKLYLNKLHNMGYEPVTFEFPAEALKAIQKDKPDLVITDLNMPMIDGLQLTQKIRVDYDEKQLPIIMITTQSDFVGSASTDKSRINDNTAFQSGVNKVLNKPFTDEDLESSIKALIGDR